MVKVKVCGITNLEDARHAVESGADILGFIFYPESKRAVTATDVAAITTDLPANVVKTGVFVNETVVNILETVTLARLDAIQLQGDETAEYIGQLSSQTDAMIVNTIHLKDGLQTEMLDEFSADAFLLDTFSPTERGGTGKTIDWNVASTFAKRVDKLYLAGGLGPDNVALAIQTVRPYAVDACSRLEVSPGKKDPAKVAAFIKAAKEAL